MLQEPMCIIFYIASYLIVLPLSLSLLYMQLAVVRATYTLVVRAHQYRNTDPCCDCSIFCDRDICRCDNSFIFCLRHSGTQEDNDATNCPLGRYTTGIVLDHDDDFNFDDLEHSSIGVMTFHGDEWPVSLCGWVTLLCNTVCKVVLILQLQVSNLMCKHVLLIL